MLCQALVAGAVIGFTAPRPFAGTQARRTSTVRLAALDQETYANLDELPDGPTPELGWSVGQTVHAVCLGLQHNDEPEEDTGMKRLYHFLHPRGRVEIAPPPPQAGLQGFVTLEAFMRDAGSPALGSLLLCSGFKLLGEPTITPGGQARGSYATQMIEVYNDAEGTMANEEDEVVHILETLIAASDDYLQTVLDAVRRGSPPPELPLGIRRSTVAIPTRARFIVQLEQERRPPYQGCWLLKELKPMAVSKFWKLNEGGEEFEGEDSD